MNKKSHISIDEIRFCSYTSVEKKKVGKNLWMLDFDARHDFLVDSTFAGIVAQIHFLNERFALEPPCGVRHKMRMALIDTTSRIEVTSCNVCTYIPKDEYLYLNYIDFPLESVQFLAGHSYKLVVHDLTASAIMGEFTFHLFGEQTLGHPTKWYEVCYGGVRPAWEDNLYKSLNTVDGHDYYVRFNLLHRFGGTPPTILPELEMRLHYPDGHYISASFKEPRCLGLEGLENNHWYVEYPFTTVRDINGIFYAELLCMEYPIAGFVFDTDREDKRGSWCGDEILPIDEYSLELATTRINNLLPEDVQKDPLSDTDDFDELLNKFIESQDEESENNEEDVCEDVTQEDEKDTEVDIPPSENHIPRFEDLTGLRQVKEKLRIYERVVTFNKMRSDMGLPTATSSLHAMFLGSPGTGKTTVAKLLGDMLHRAGVLSKGHVVVRERATLLGQFYHSEAEKTLKAIEEAQGGILLIDEAYQLYQPDDARDPGKFVIETLLTSLSDESQRDWMLVLAGYPEDMMRMFDMNPGFKSRIPESNIYMFEDFSENELMEIAENYLSRYQYTLSPETRTALAERIKHDYLCREKNFGNARHIINMIQTEILPAMAVRVVTEGELGSKALTEIKPSDIPKPHQIKLSIPSRPRIGFAV